MAGWEDEATTHEPVYSRLQRKAWGEEVPPEDEPSGDHAIVEEPEEPPAED